MVEAVLEFEKPIATLEKKLQEMRELSRQEGVDLSHEITAVEEKISDLIDRTYSTLGAWQKVQLSRHPNRPYALDYIQKLFPDFMEVHGDRAFGDDLALIAGFASWPPESSSKKKMAKQTVAIIGHQKGRTTKQKMERNFGMARPEGYRKAMRIMELAERMRIPIITFVDTPGAFPSVDAEERGQSQAIAESICTMSRLTVPVLTVVIGEGGSGGALAIGLGNKILMQEYSTYSVISPEGCASILWSDASYSAQASESLKMNPPELLKLKIIDAIIPEPKGGAHRDWETATQLLGQAIVQNLEPMIKGMDGSRPVRTMKKAASRLKGVRKKKKTAKKASAPMENEKIRSKIREDRLVKFRGMGNTALGRFKEQTQRGAKGKKKK